MDRALVRVHEGLNFLFFYWIGISKKKAFVAATLNE